MTGSEQQGKTILEAVGVFNDVRSLQAAIDDLQEHGFMQQELSVLAGDKAIEEKLGHIYQRVEEAEDDPEAPRKVFVPLENIGDAEGALLGTPLYIAATSATAITVASGGTILAAIFAAAAAGAVGAAIGSILAGLVAKNYADEIQEHLDHGGFLLWVNLRTPELAEKAREIMGRHSAHDVHMHKIPLAG
ncbi:hypothetical protein [Emcibacter nanhaiensis]|uniref:General stress protein 17M-like domain-containing protein n=1 Tax=Emcibacter nanhaiensis TaxID=1505037 RepID=A0A501PGF5_9PROT|nr:hypothetical protein [Emcibacter nanhaiensis]TPD59092.1 hypothetical protein FIV46_12725 [Emcibacter nanhaiensis]